MGKKDKKKWMRRTSSKTFIILPSIFFFLLLLAVHPGLILSAHAQETWVSIGPFGTPQTNKDVYGGQVNALIVDPTNSAILYVGASEGGVWKSSNGGNTWKSITDGQLVRELPVPSAPLRGTQSIGALALDPDNPKILYAGTGDPNPGGPFLGDSLGVFRSIDGGTSWQVAGANLNQPGNSSMTTAMVFKIVVRRGTPNTVIAATDFGLFEYPDDGTDTWKKLTNANNGVPDSGPVCDMVNDVQIYVAFQGKGIFRSVPSIGEPKFIQLTSGLPASGFGRIALAISASQPNILYAGFDAAGEFGRRVYRLFRTLDGGDNWTELPLPPSDGQLNFNNVIAVDPGNAGTVYIGQINLWRAIDGGLKGGFNDYKSTPPVTGNSWTNLSCCMSDPNPFRRGLDHHGDLHAIAFDPSNSRVIYTGSDGGVTKGVINDVGVVTWQSLTAGLAIGQYGTIGLSPRNFNAVVGGLWHNGNTITENGGIAFTQVGGGDGFQAKIDAGSVEGKPIVYYNCNAFGGGAICRARIDLGHIVPLIKQEVIWSDPSTLAYWSDPYRPGHLLRVQSSGATSNPGKLLLTTNAASAPKEDIDKETSWSLLEPPGKSGNTVTVAFKRPQSVDEKPVYYLGTDTGEVWRGSPDAGWSKIYNGPGPAINGIGPDPNDPNRVFIVFAGNTGSGRVAEIVLGPSGGAIVTFIDHAFNTDGIEVRRLYNVVVDPLLADTLYVGTDQGIFRGQELSLGIWEFSRSPGVPHVDVTDLAIHDSTGGPSGVVRAGTYGRGIFELQRPSFISTLVALSVQAAEVGRGTATPSLPVTILINGLTQLISEETPFNANLPPGSPITLVAPGAIQVGSERFDFVEWKVSGIQPSPQPTIALSPSPSQITISPNQNTTAIAYYKLIGPPVNVLSVQATQVGEEGTSRLVSAKIKVAGPIVVVTQETPFETFVQKNSFYSQVTLVAPLKIRDGNEVLEFVGWAVSGVPAGDGGKVTFAVNHNITAVASYEKAAIILSVAGDTFISARSPERFANFGNEEKLSIIRGVFGFDGNFQDFQGTLIRFDLSGIPEEVEIVKAELFLLHSNEEREIISVHRMVKDWKELEASWFEPCQGCEPWWPGWSTSSPKNYAKQGTDSQLVTKNIGWVAWDVTRDVKLFLSGTQNAGWFLKSFAPMGVDQTSVDFLSRKHPNPDFRPYLKIDVR